MTAAEDLITRSTRIYPLGPRTIIQVGGHDRATFLHNFCTNDVRSLQTGDGCEAFVTDVKGHVLGLIIMLARDDEILVWTVSGQAPALITHWDRYCVREQVTFQDQSDQWMSYCIQCDGDDAGMGQRTPRRLSHFEIEVEGQRMLFAREMLDDPATWLCLVPASSADRLLSFGRHVGASLGSWSEFDALRISRGIPEFGRDAGAENLPQEVNRDRQAISFKKGCYLGQETVARIDALGHVNRLLVRLRFPEGRLPEPGAPLVAIDPDRPVGQVTSVAPLAEHHDAVGLGYVRREHAGDGSLLSCPVGPVQVLSRPEA